MANMFPTVAVVQLVISSLLASSAQATYFHVYPPVQQNDTRTPLYFGFITSFSGDFVSSGSVPGVQVALDQINSNPSLLPGYTLHYTLTDSQVNHRYIVELPTGEWARTVYNIYH